MTGIGMICGLLIVLTYEGTRDRIDKLRKEALEKAIVQVLPGTSHTQVFVWKDHNFQPSSFNEPSEEMIYAGFNQQNELIGFAIPASGQGYADLIGILYGYSLEREAVIGFQVLETKETPGLGDKIQKDPDFLENFEQLDLSVGENGELLHEVVTVKNGIKQERWQIDGITGATISSRAIGEILNQSAQKWMPRLNQNQKVFENGGS